MDMMQIDNAVRNQTTYENMLAGFNSLNGKTFNG